MLGAVCFAFATIAFTHLSVGDLCAYAADGIALNSQNFPDEMFRDEVSWLTDKDQNSTLSSSEIKAVTDMEFAGIYVDGHAYVIANCKGLEYFTELKKLNLYRNALKSLDISKNTKLEMLDCSCNTISSLDVSKNPNLKDLYCCNTLITQIDISNNKYLLKAYNSPTSTVVNDTYTTYEYSNGTEKYYFAVNNSVKVITQNKPAVADGIAVNNSNFPDDVFRNYINISFDKDGNGYLSNSEISAVKEIKCTPYGTLGDSRISSFKGIEYFTALETFDCNSNDVSSLDLSKNTKLTYLNCLGNFRLASLDLSKNTKLKTLYCGQTMLTHLDVSKNTELTELDFANTQLGDVDLSKNTNLVKVSATRSGLTSLNISKCTKLESLTCDFDPNLAKLDISNCPNLVKAYKEHTNNVQQDSYGIIYEYTKSGKNYRFVVSPETKVTAEIQKPQTTKPAATTSETVTTTKKPAETSQTTSTVTTTAETTPAQTEASATTTKRSDSSAVSVLTTAAADSSLADKSSIADSSKKSGFSALYIVIPAAVVVIGGAIGAVLYIKHKKK